MFNLVQKKRERRHDTVTKRIQVVQKANVLVVQFYTRYRRKKIWFFFYNYTHRWFLARIYIRGNIAALILCLIAYLNMPRKYVQWPTISQYLFYNWLRYARFRVYLDIFFFIPSQLFYDWIAFLIKEFESVYRKITFCLIRLNFIRDEGTSSQNQNILR